MAFNWRGLFARRTPSPSVYSSRRGFSYGGGVSVSEDSAMSVSAFNRGVIYISTQIAKLPWDIKDSKFNVIENHRVGKILNLSPNPEMNAMTFRLLMVQTAITTGNFYAEIERDGAGRPVALWPLPWRDVELLRTSGGELVYKISNSGQYSISKKDTFLPSWDVFHIRNFHTRDGLLGMGVVEYAKETLGISISADRMASGIFQNGGKPAGVLKHPGKLSDEAYKRLKETWEAQHGGRKSGGTALLEEGVTYEAISMDPETLQFLESRKFGVLEIARFLGLPPTKLFDVTGTTFSNMENANLEVTTDTLDSWARNLEMEADIKLLTNQFGGAFSEIDIKYILRGDMKTRADYFKAMMSVGAITPNQIRTMEGMAPYDEGDNYYIATNNYTPVDRMDEVIDAQIKSKEPKDVTPVEDDDDKQIEKDLKLAALKRLNEK